jgi:predicted AlkP superfamily pyrophosphatase or phosphodiesterase
LRDTRSVSRTILWLCLGWSLLPGSADAQSVSRGKPGAGQTVVLVALDGFHPDYLSRKPSHNLRHLAEEGVRARWMIPVFPTLTFPNFYSIATGLYPEHHGIVSNTIKDTALGRFTLRDTAAARDPRWWAGEPIWVTAEKQEKRAATFFWPGSDVAIAGVRPTYYKEYDGSVPNAERVRQVLEWLALPADSAPDLVTLYLSDVDQAGHDFGPSSPETDSAIARVDRAVGALLQGLQKLGLDRRVNVVVVSDHGMAELRPGQVIYLDDYVDTATVDVVDLGPVLSLNGRWGNEAEAYRRLRGAHPHLTVYRKSEVPEQYHYRAHHRIPGIIGVADEGWMVTTRAQAASRGGRGFPRGHHGYPPELPSMRALFIARGPAFDRGAVVEPFQNIHIYSLVVKILGLRPAATDGVLDSIKSVLAETSD